MIPAFDERGNLPPGQHPAQWDEISARFGHSPARRELLVGLRRAIDLLLAAGCRRIWLAGSFVSDAEAILGRAPRDVDVCWDISTVNLGRLRAIAPGLDPLQPDRDWQRHYLGGDYFAVAEPIDTNAPGLLVFFSRDRNKNPKGLVLLELATEPRPRHDRE